MLNDGKHFLTAGEIKRLAPSVFASGPAETCSENYSFIPTSDIIERLSDNYDYGVTYVGEARTRKDENKGFQKHLVRLRSRSGEMSSSVPEIILLNSHNRGGAFGIMPGLFKFACANGLIIADEKHDEFRVSHSRSDAFAQTILHLREMADVAAQRRKAIDEWADVRLTWDDELSFAKKMFSTRYFPELYDTYEGNYARLLKRRRREDVGNDVFTTMNVVQENLLRGGYRLIKSDGSASRTTTEVQSLDLRTHINQEVWRLADKVARNVGVLTDA